MKILERLAALALVALASTGCAKGERQIDIRADVRVTVWEAGAPLAAGKPARPIMQADRSHVLEIRAEGYETQTVRLEPHTDAGNVASYVLECLVFPPALLALPLWLSCGAFEELEPHDLDVVMVPAR